MKKSNFFYFVMINMAIVGCVFLLGLIFLFHYYGGYQLFGGDSILWALSIVLFSSPLWLSLFGIGITRIKSNTLIESILFPFPLIFMVTFILVLYGNIVD